MSNPEAKVSMRTMRWKMFLMGFFKIPLIGYIRPKLLEIDDKKIRVQINLRRRTKNHLNSMYFGALAVGADIAGGIHVFYFAELSNHKVSFSFKSMKAEFIKRAESHVIFQSMDGQLVKEAIEKSKISGERVNQSITVTAIDTDEEIVASFEMTVSVRCK
jgi:acyl-coenzyme A thioesterase PaaI-like protein